MSTMKLTPAAVAKLKAPTRSGRQEIVWDAELRGFGILLSGVSSARTFIVQRKLPDRRTRRVTVGPANVLSLEDARRRALEILRDFASGLDPKAERRRKAVENITVREALGRFLGDRPDLSVSVSRQWPRYFDLYLNDWLDKPLRTIDAAAVQERRGRIMDVVRRAGRPRTAAAVTAPGSGAAGLTLCAFRTVRNHVAEAAGLPAMKLRAPRGGGEKRRERMLRSEEMPAFYRAAAALDNPQHRDLTLLLLFTGLRFGEASALRWADIDLPQRAIRIPAAATKARRRLDLPMTTQVADILIARRAVGIEGEFVFPAIRRTNTAGHVTDSTSAFDRIAAAAGVRVSPHDLRRTWATVAEDCDISGLALKALLNHALPDDVSAGYVRMTLDRLRQPAQRVADRIAELCAVVALPEGVEKLGA